jgi:hypothetical protein
MRRNSVLLSQQKAERARAVRVEIGRRLREQFGAGAPPMPTRLADLVRQIERSAASASPDDAGCRMANDHVRRVSGQCA